MREMVLIVFILFTLSYNTIAQTPLRNNHISFSANVNSIGESYKTMPKASIQLNIQNSYRTKKAGKFLMLISPVLLAGGIVALVGANQMDQDTYPQAFVQVLGTFCIGGSIGTGITGSLLYRKEQRRAKASNLKNVAQ